MPWALITRMRTGSFTRLSDQTPTWGRPNSRVTRGHLKQPSADTAVRTGVSVSLSQNASQKFEVLRQTFATQKPFKTKGMRPSRRNLNFRDMRGTDAPT